MVVFLHGYNANIAHEKHAGNELFEWIRNFQLFFSDGVFRVAVPLFFAISGFLQVGAFKHGFNVENYLKLLRKRFFSLFIPLVVASFIFLAIFSFFSHFPPSQALFGRSYSLLPLDELFYKIVYTPVPFQFWFIRFLLQYIIILPLIYVAIRLFGAFYILILYLTWFNFEFQMLVSTYLLGIESFFFFSLGVYFGMHKELLERTKLKGLQLVAIGCLWIAVLLIRFKYYPYPVLRDQLLVLAISAGVVFIWYFYDKLENLYGLSAKLKVYSAFSFGIFIFHEPLLSLIKKLMIRIGNYDTGIYMLTYLLAPLVSILVAYYTARLLKLKLPRFYSIISGGR
jgi:peptidoglycan/LPS O-acetylase OafA/YrhL